MTDLDGAAATRGIAAFDFDGTVTRRDTLLGFLVRVGGRTRTGAAMARHAVGLAVGVRDDAVRDRTKERVVGAVLTGRSHDELDALGESYAADIVASRLRPEVLDEVRAHQRAGRELVIVSASLVHYLRPVAATLGFDHVIGVELAFDDSGRATGELAAANVRAEQKAVRLRSWMDGTGDGGAVEVWAYGNSSGDDELLAMADHPRWVGRRAGRDASR